MEGAATEPPVWTERLQVRSYDVDATRRATVPSLCRYFLEAAWNHAEALGVGFTHLQGQGKFWVLARLVCAVEQYPVWGDAVILQTWPRGIKSAFALREFEFKTETGARLAAGSSAWLVLDSLSKRPQRLAKLLPEFVNLAGEATLGRDPARLEDIPSSDGQFPITARYTDIDVNQHVNSSRYVAWILDAYPADFHRQHSLRLLEVNYLSETVEGEELIVHTTQTDPTGYSHLLTKSGGAEVCRARLEWAQKS